MTLWSRGKWLSQVEIIDHGKTFGSVLNTTGSHWRVLNMKVTWYALDF